MRLSFVFVLVAAALLLSACGDGSSLVPTGAQTAQLAPARQPMPTAFAPTPSPDREADASSCPVTRPPTPPFEPSFTPPLPTPPEAPKGQFWYGSAALWTALPLEGAWYDLPLHEGVRGQKSVWWSEGYSWTAEPEPALTVTGRRLDGDAPPLAPHPATNGYHDDWGSFMLTGLAFPTAGCWELTGSYRDAQLTVVIWIAP